MDAGNEVSRLINNTKHKGRAEYRLNVPEDLF